MVAVKTVLSIEHHALLRGVTPEQHLLDVQESIRQTQLLVPLLNFLFKDRKFMPRPGIFSTIEIAKGEIEIGFEKLEVSAVYHSEINRVLVKVRRTKDDHKPIADFDNVKICLINDAGNEVGFSGFDYSSNSLGLHSMVTPPRNATELELQAIANI